MAGALPGAACGVARRERAATRGMAGARRGRDVRVEAGRHAARRISPCGMPRHERGIPHHTSRAFRAPGTFDASGAPIPPIRREPARRRRKRNRIENDSNRDPNDSGPKRLSRCSCCEN